MSNTILYFEYFFYNFIQCIISIHLLFVILLTLKHFNLLTIEIVDDQGF